jgi:hypothetical protein
LELFDDLRICREILATLAIDGGNTVVEEIRINAGQGVLRCGGIRGVHEAKVKERRV